MSKPLTNVSRATIYIDRDGEQISAHRWKDLRSDPRYCTIRGYDNGVYSVRVAWLGEIQKPNAVRVEDWKPYVFAVGKRSEKIADNIDPQPETRKCRTEQEAIEAYEDFLVRKCGCEWFPSPGGQGNAANPGFHFIERGNFLKPMSADVPTAIGGKGAELVGSW